MKLSRHNAPSKQPIVSPLTGIMLVIGLIFLVYSPLYPRTPDRNHFGAPEGLLEEEPEGRVPTVMLITGASLLAGAGVLVMLRDKEWASLAVVLAVGGAVRLAFAFGFFGTSDVALYYQWPDYLRSGDIYRYPEVYAWPPPLIFVVTGLDWIADNTGIPLYGLVTLPPTLADLAIGVLIYVIGGEEQLSAQRRLGASALYVLNPVSILVSGMHIQFGSVYILPVLLAFYVLVYKKRFEWAAAWFGISLAIMLVPVLFIPAFLAHVEGWRKRIVFLALAATPSLLVSLPYLLQDPFTMISNYLSYKSEFGVWGTSFLLSQFTANIWAGPGGGLNGYARAYGMYGVLLLYITLALTVFRRMKLINALSLTVIIFYLNPTGFAIQYIIFLAPFVILEFDSHAGIWYTILGSIFAISIYTGNYFYPWLNRVLPVWPNPTRLLSLPVWVWCVGEFGRRLLPYIRRLSQPLISDGTPG